MKKVGIIGFGRFGELLSDLAKDTFDIRIIEESDDRCQAAESRGYSVIPFESIASLDIIILAVPISQIEKTIIALSPLLNETHVVIDICSVKTYPSNLMQKYLGQCQLLATHPMFGPDSAKQGLEGLQVAFCPLTIDAENMDTIKKFWENTGASVEITTPEKHDKDSVYSQAFTYSIAKIILETQLPEITFKTRSFTAITEVARLSSNDSEQLFHDMLYYNPYYPEMKRKLENAITSTLAAMQDIEDDQLMNHLEL